MRQVLLQVRQVLQSVTILLQSATGITKCDDYYKVRQYTRCFWENFQALNSYYYPDHKTIKRLLAFMTDIPSGWS